MKRNHSNKKARMEQSRRPKKNPLKAAGVEKVDYKDINRLRRFTNERGKILPRRMSGNCAKHQRQLSEAIKRARAIALLPFMVD